MNVFRSYLFVPAKEISIIKKAVESTCDCVIIDLEDAVAFSEKDNARNIVKQALQQFDGVKPIFVRINDFTTLFWEKDLLCSIMNGASGVIVSKTENKQQILSICEKVREVIFENDESVFLKGDKKENFEVIPLIETASGVQHAYEIAGADPLISRLAFGSIDYSLDIGCELTSGRSELLYTLSRIVVASRAADKEGPIDAVFPDLKNLSGLEQEAVQAKQLGFKGKLTIHPKQIDIVNKVFSPGEKELSEAREIVERFEKAEQDGSASIAVNGSLVDYPVYKKAKEMLRRDKALRP